MCSLRRGAKGLVMRPLCVVPKKWGESYINYSKKHLASGTLLWHNLSTAAVRKEPYILQPPGPHYYIWEGNKSAQRDLYPD